MGTALLFGSFFSHFAYLFDIKEGYMIKSPKYKI
jgi:hypothetical protein